MENKIFDPRKLKKLNNPKRLIWIPPESICEILNINSTSSLVDIGAGSGYFTKWIAEMYPESNTFAIDIEPIMIRYLTENMPENIKPLLIKDGIFPIPDNSIDAIWTIAVYHEISKIELFMEQVKRVLKPGGKILIIDWEKKEESSVNGPPLDHRIAIEQVKNDLQKSGFHNISFHNDFKFHLAISAIS